MSYWGCDPHSLTITDQADINDGPLQQFLDDYSTICVRNATGTLTFSNLAMSLSIDVQESPRLEILEFPNLYKLEYLVINQATSLTNISLPFLGSSNGYFESLTLNITSAPSLKHFAVPDSSCLYSIILLDVEDFPSEVSSNISTIYNISANTYLPLHDLTSASSLDFRHSHQVLPNLTSVDNISLINASLLLTLPTDGDLPPGARDPSTGPLQIEDTMAIELSTYDYGYPFFHRIERIGGDLNISSNRDADFAYDDLTEVGRGLSIWNNTNCTFNFDAVSNISTLIFTDNVSSQVPRFTSLERAESIHISGFIDTSSGSNIFPALRYVPGNVTVEALNYDFDCSKLVSQWKDQTIHNLKCIGRNNVTDDSPPRSDNSTNTSKPTSNQSLSPGAWAGVGVGTSIAVIGILGALIWIIIHFRNRLRTLERENAQRPDENESLKGPEQPRMMQEVCGRGIFREKPDDPLVEMPTQPAELSTRPHSWAGTEEGEGGRAL